MKCISILSPRAMFTCPGVNNKNQPAGRAVAPPSCYAMLCYATVSIRICYDFFWVFLCVATTPRRWAEVKNAHAHDHRRDRMKLHAVKCTTVLRRLRARFIHGFIWRYLQTGSRCREQVLGPSASRACGSCVVDCVSCRVPTARRNQSDCGIIHS